MPLDQDILESIINKDVDSLIEAEKHYGDSWKKRGGVDSFMMLARKWDRIEHQVEEHEFNILKACTKDVRPEGIIDDIQDLRRYLILVEHEVRQWDKDSEGRPEEPGTEYVNQDGPKAPAVPRPQDS